jgi:DNA polymerase III delta prime subunit|tara:strand:+ start:212 stop:1144 length:933 start_codon:yes stop_codon:yes gene_type:complete
MIKKEKHSLWVERYRPDSMDGYVGNQHIIEKVKIYIESNDVPHLLLYGQAGTGKTTLAKIITNQIDCDLMYINASDENSVDAVRDKIRGFASSMGFKEWKIVILDEADYLTPNAQAALRNLMETFSRTTRFILTCNYVEKVIDPIQSRCQTFGITPPSKKEVAMRLKQILDMEEVKYEMSDLAILVNSGYPDIRRVLNAAQRQVVGNELKIDKTSAIQANYMDEVLTVLQSNGSVKDSFTNVRKIIADSKVRDFTPFYRFLYDEVDNYANGKIGSTILNIADAQYKDSAVVDKEISVMAMLLEIITDIRK